MLMSGRIIPTVFGKGQRFPGFGPPLTCALELSRHLWAFLLIEGQGLVLSAILVPLDSSWFILCPWAMSRSSALERAMAVQHWSSREEIPHVQGQEQWLYFAGVVMRRYPKSKARENPVRW